MKTKQILLVMAICAMSISAYSQTKVPAAVKEAFVKKHPLVKGAVWELENGSEYEAEFKENGKGVSVVFNKEGKWLSTGREISVSLLPKAVSDAVKKEFPGYKIDEAEKVETAQRKVMYEIEIQKGSDEWDVLLSSDGKIVKKEKEEDGDD